MPAGSLRFVTTVLLGNQSIAFPDSSSRPILAVYPCPRRVLSHADIHWDAKKATGRPFYYFAMGRLQRGDDRHLTGEMKSSASISFMTSAIRSSGDRHRPDRGGFVQAWDGSPARTGVRRSGRLLTHAPRPTSPLRSDVPPTSASPCSTASTGRHDLRSKRGSRADAAIRCLAIADAIHSLRRAPGAVDAPATRSRSCGP